jgi:predicted phage terminase large subunit-like protein
MVQAGASRTVVELSQQFERASPEELMQLLAVTPEDQLLEVFGEDGLRAVLNVGVQDLMASARKSMSAHVALFNRDNFGRPIVPARVHREMIRILQDRVRYRWVVIVAPPGYAKSTICSMAYPAWRLGQEANLRIGVISNAARLAYGFQQSIREVVLNPLYAKTYGPGHEPDYLRGWKQDEMWITGSNDDANPSVLGTGLGGTQIQGKRFDEIVLDDPTTEEEARSQQVMEGQRNRVTRLLLNRFPPGMRPPHGEGRMVVVLTRWGENDLVPLFEDLGFRIIRMPALGYWDREHECRTCGARARVDEPLCSCPEVEAAIARDPILGRDEVCEVHWGEEALWPEHESQEALEEEREKEPLSFELVKQGDAAAVSGGKMFDPENFRRAEPPDLDEFEKVIQYLDPAGGQDRKKGDYAAHVTIGYRGNEVWVLHVERGRIPTTKQEAMIPELYDEWSTPDLRPRRIGIENDGRGTAIYQHLEQSEHRLPLDLDDPVGDKEFRATPVANAYAAGRVVHAYGRWNREFENELKAFPNAPHDDQVDALSGAYNLTAKRKKPRVRRVR